MEGRGGEERKSNSFCLVQEGRDFNIGNGFLK